MEEITGEDIDITKNNYKEFSTKKLVELKIILERFVEKISIEIRKRVQS